jgi:3-phosphoshikimate 1-carboxyvinyltransferase
LTAWRLKQAGIDWADEAGSVQKLLHRAGCRVFPRRYLLDGVPVGDAIRTEEMSPGASKVPRCRRFARHLLFRQRAFNTAPGLVGDGRDMGSVVFPKAPLKVFLTASAEARAERRYKQLIEKGFSANLPDLLLDLQQRDERDSQRSVAPLRQEADAKLLDTTHLTIEQAVNQVLEWAGKHCCKGVAGRPAGNDFFQL